MEVSTQISQEALGGQAGLGSLQAAPERATHEAVRVKLKTQWRLQEVKGTRNMEHLLRQRPCGLQMARLWWQGFPNPLKLTSYHCMPQMVNLMIKDLLFALLGFGLALFPFLLSMPSFLSFRMEGLLCAIASWKYVTCF
jgi:hypothetical protein